MDSMVWISAVSLVVACGIGWMFTRLIRKSTSCEVDLAWWSEFDPSRYAPMLRVLDQGEFDYLGSLGVGRGATWTEFRRNRIRVMRGYLREMATDFNRLQVVGQLLVSAGVAGAELREELFRQKVRFTANLWLVRLQTAGFALGLTGVNAGALLDPIGELAGELKQRFGTV